MSASKCDVISGRYHIQNALHNLIHLTIVSIKLKVVYREKAHSGNGQKNKDCDQRLYS